MRGDDLRHRQQEVRAKAERVWAAAPLAPDTHPYLARKAVCTHGLRVFKGALVVPVRDLAGALHSLQFISPGGVKRFLRGGRVKGLCGWIGELPPPSGDAHLTLLVAEGVATAVSLHEASGHPVVIAFHAGNLGVVATALRARYPQARIVVCADDDNRTAGNPGRTHAADAARVIGGLVAEPNFGDDRPEGATDFNDLHRLLGLSAVRTALAAARTPPPVADAGSGSTSTAHLSNTATMTSAGLGTSAATGMNTDSATVDRAWPDAEPLTAPVDSQPYPIDALPAMLRDAVLEAQAFVQAPAALVACSALSALSVAAQGLVNVRRDPQLAGPVSLYLLSVAESGERKTTCDRIFGAALRDWERDRALACTQELAEYETASASYEAKRAGLLESIKRKRRDAQDTSDDDRALVELRATAPQPVSVPRLLYADATPEALSHALATGWPSAAVMSAEAGAVFGAHGMGYETILRNLALINVLWDGGEIAVDRRSKPSFRLRDRRLTFGVMVQPEALRGFIERAGALPRGSGFIARFLIAWPDSTQGQRPYRPAPEVLPAVDAFNARVRALLDTPLAMDAQGGLSPTMLDLSHAARAAWVQAHDRIERQLGGGGDYAAIRDVAAKAAENIARLAALLHVLDHGADGAIDAGCIERAVRIVDWHLREASRLLADLDAPPELAAAIRFDAWLRSEAARTGDPRIASGRIYQYGPGCVRDSNSLRAALALLEERGRARAEQEGRHRVVVVNPALLDAPVVGP
jgi:putative DNA primase/helicase